MHEDLIKRLRDIASHDSNIESNYIGLALLQAADAIEAMNYEIKSLYKLLGTHPDPRGENGEMGVECMVLSKMEKTARWIPVTERLPEKTGKYLVCGQWRGEPAETWVCELIAFGKIKGWANEARNPAVTHWMPLPEPPKEEQGDV